MGIFKISRIRRAAFVAGCIATIAAAAPVAPASAQMPDIRATWYIGEPIPNPDLPTHFSLGPGVTRVVVIAQSRLLPNVLVEIDGPAGTPGWGSFSLPKGTQLFQLARQSRPTFCTFTAEPKAYHCFLDSDGDGKLDAVAKARPPVPGPSLRSLDSADLAPTTAPIGFTQIAREQSRERMSIALGFYGRRQTARRDASFMISVVVGKAAATSQMIAIYLDALPAEFDIAGVKFVNLVRNQKKLEFDVANGFPPGPFDPIYGARAFGSGP